jgi:hypothetical protein
MNFFLHKGRAAQRPEIIPDDCIAIFGQVRDGPILLGRAQLENLPEGSCVPDVGAFAQGERGKAVGVHAVVEAAAPKPGTLYVNFENRSGSRRLSHFLTEVAELGWIAYTGGRQASGPFRLILPGIPGDRGRMSDLASIEFADDPCDESPGWNRR